MTLTIRPATPADLKAAVELLSAAGLCVDDLSAERLALVAEKGEIIQGVIGLETFGRIALLRSLVVTGDARGAGIGAALVTALETTCIADGVAELWLLTFDADVYFAKWGYVMRDRADVPDVIRNTEEFSELCPADTVLMSKSLQDIPSNRPCGCLRH